MDIEQLKKERGHLETAISFMLYEFSEQTKTEVVGIKVTAVHEMGRLEPINYLIEVEVRV